MTKAACNLIIKVTKVCLVYRSIKALKRSGKKEREGGKGNNSDYNNHNYNDHNYNNYDYNLNYTEEIDLEILQLWSIIALLTIYDLSGLEYAISFFPLYYYFKMILILITAIPSTKFPNFWCDIVLIPMMNKCHEIIDIGTSADIDWKELIEREVILLPFRILDITVCPGLLCDDYTIEQVQERRRVQLEIARSDFDLYMSQKAEMVLQENDKKDDDADASANADEDKRSEHVQPEDEDKDGDEVIDDTTTNNDTDSTITEGKIRNPISPRNRKLSVDLNNQNNSRNSNRNATRTNSSSSSPRRKNSSASVSTSISPRSTKSSRLRSNDRTSPSQQGRARGRARGQRPGVSSTPVSRRTTSTSRTPTSKGTTGSTRTSTRTSITSPAARSRVAASSLHLRKFSRDHTPSSNLLRETKSSSRPAPASTTRPVTRPTSRSTSRPTNGRTSIFTRGSTNSSTRTSRQQNTKSTLDRSSNPRSRTNTRTNTRTGNRSNPRTNTTMTTRSRAPPTSAFQRTNNKVSPSKDKTKNKDDNETKNDDETEMGVQNEEKDRFNALLDDEKDNREQVNNTGKRKKSLTNRLRNFITGDTNIRIRDYLFDLDLPTAPSRDSNISPSKTFDRNVQMEEEEVEEEECINNNTNSISRTNSSSPNKNKPGRRKRFSNLNNNNHHEDSRRQKLEEFKKKKNEQNKSIESRRRQIGSGTGTGSPRDQRRSRLTSTSNVGIRNSNRKIIDQNKVNGSDDSVTLRRSQRLSKN